MRIRLLALAAAAAVFAGMGSYANAAGGSAAGPVARANSTCDRACLKNMMDEYVVALVKHDDSGLPLAKDVKFTENTATLPLGDGLWVGVTQGPTTFKIYGLDPVAGQAGLFCMMKEFGKPVIVSIRLRVQGGKITEIEHIVTRNPRESNLANLVTPRPGLLADVPPSERTPREKMREIAGSYFGAVNQRDASHVPFADDCERHENGAQTTSNKTLPKTGPDGRPLNPAMAKLLSASCAEAGKIADWSYITKIDPERILIVDEQKGLVFAYPMFVHRGKVREMKIYGVPGVTSIPINFGPINMEATEIFKIHGGKIHEIEAMGFLLPYNSKTGWE
jgi:hypothetical protein